jgi:tetratricopeptide (TPR) repeat protein
VIRTAILSRGLLLAPLLFSGCAANQFYDAALKTETRPLATLEYYKACLDLEPAHEQARPRFDGQDFYAKTLKEAERLEAKGDYLSALGYYDQLLDIEFLVRGAGGNPAPVDLGDKRDEVILSASKQKFAEAEELRAAGEAKDATKAYRYALALDPTNVDARRLYKQQKAEATQRVAILPFKCEDEGFSNQAKRMSDRMVAKAIAGQPEFLQFIDRNNLADLLDEHDLNASGLVDMGSAAETGKLLGLHAIVYGTLRFECSDTGWEETPGENTIVLTQKDEQGNPVEVEAGAKWVVFSRTTRARALAGYQVVSVETGEIMAAQDTLDQNSVDEVRYAQLVSGDEKAVPADVRDLLNAQARDPQDPNAMIDGLVNPLSERLAKKLLKQFR